MSLSKDDFKAHWLKAGESDEPHFVETAWRRYQQVQSNLQVSSPQSDDLSAEAMDKGFNALISNQSISDAVAGYRLLSLPANRIPWTPTGIRLTPQQTVSTFSSGRVWRSRLLDLYLQPQFALWFKIGINGRVFNSAGNSNTFTATDEGELYFASQFPNQFASAEGGRVYDALGSYHKADGKFEILIVTWKAGTNTHALFQGHSGSDQAGRALLDQELLRLQREGSRRPPPDWSYLWFLGKSTIYAAEQQGCINCKPNQTVGIIQKVLDPALPFTSSSVVTWDWNIASLPSRLREDTTFTHDYLSLAFEFENGRDLTYTWSWELPVDYYGYWCPLPTWTDREYHVVIRSGTKQLGEWLGERRDLYQDYIKYIDQGKEDKEQLPKQIVKVWLIAGNWFQKHEGEMTIKSVKIGAGDGAFAVL